MIKTWYNCGILNGNVDRLKQYVCEVRALDCCDVDRLVADLRSAPWWMMKTLDNILDSQWEYWKKLYTFNRVLDSHAPLKILRVRKKTLPWISPNM